ncbi:hypothetical protein Tco_0789318 [Tanacetum coccineum]
MATFEVLDELMEITGSTELHKRMRFWFVQEIAEEEGLLKFLRDRCDDLRRKIARRLVLIREMEALGDAWMAVDSLECLKQTNARETAKLVGLTDVMAENSGWDVDDIDFRYLPSPINMAVSYNTNYQHYEYAGRLMDMAVTSTILRMMLTTVCGLNPIQYDNVTPQFNCISRVSTIPLHKSARYQGFGSY